MKCLLVCVSACCTTYLDVVHVKLKIKILVIVGSNMYSRWDIMIMYLTIMYFISDKTNRTDNGLVRRKPKRWEWINLSLLPSPLHLPGTGNQWNVSTKRTHCLLARSLSLNIIEFLSKKGQPSKPRQTSPIHPNATSSCAVMSFSYHRLYCHALLNQSIHYHYPSIK